MSVWQKCLIHQDITNKYLFTEFPASYVLPRANASAPPEGGAGQRQLIMATRGTGSIRELLSQSKDVTKV